MSAPLVNPPGAAPAVDLHAALLELADILAHGGAVRPDLAERAHAVFAALGGK